MVQMVKHKPSRHKTKKETFSFRLPTETKRLLELAADRTGRTLGGYVDYAKARMSMCAKVYEKHDLGDVD
jgi:uncharacterized protein (DUF1778 family)